MFKKLATGVTLLTTALWFFRSHIPIDSVKNLEWEQVKGWIEIQGQDKQSNDEHTLAIPNGDTVQRCWPGLPKVGPEIADRIQILERKGFVVGYSYNKLVPLWVTYTLHGVDNPKSAERPNSFNVDTDVPERYQVRPEEYTRSGYDRGHMAPNWAISINFGRDAQIETFALTNICPQRPKCNRETWGMLEKIEANNWAKRYKETVTFTGPVFSGPREYIDPENQRIRIPDAFFKIIIRKKEDGTPDAIGFVVPQEATGSQQTLLNRYITPISEIETLTGLEFFPNIPEDQVFAIKKIKPKLWK